MFESLWRNKTWPIALDIGTDCVKMLQLQGQQPALRVRACSRWNFPEPDLNDPVQRRKIAVEAIRRMLKSGRFAGRSVISSLHCSLLNIKNVRLPHMSEQELGEAVKWEARDRLGFEVDSDQLKYLMAGQVRTETDMRDEVILIACRQTDIDEHLRLLNEAGLRPLHIEPEPIALFRVNERFLRRQIDDEAVTVIADIGLAFTRVIIARGRQIVFIKPLDIAGKKFNEAVAANLNLSYADARDLRLRMMRRPIDAKSSDPLESVEWRVSDAMRGDVSALAREISLCLRYCAVTFRGLRPSGIMITGGEAYDRLMVKLLREHLSTECSVGQPLRGVDISGVDVGAERRGMLSEWAVCAGLAMRDIDHNAEQEVNDARHRLSA